MIIHYKIPDDIHRQAKTAAAIQGISLKDFITAAIEEAATIGLLDLTPSQQARTRYALRHGELPDL